MSLRCHFVCLDKLFSIDFVRYIFPGYFILKKILFTYFYMNMWAGGADALALELQTVVSHCVGVGN